MVSKASKSHTSTWGGSFLGNAANSGEQFIRTAQVLGVRSTWNNKCWWLVWAIWNLSLSHTHTHTHTHSHTHIHTPFISLSLYCLPSVSLVLMRTIWTLSFSSSVSPFLHTRTLCLSFLSHAHSLFLSFVFSFVPALYPSVSSRLRSRALLLNCLVDVWLSLSRSRALLRTHTHIKSAIICFKYQLLALVIFVIGNYSSGLYVARTLSCLLSLLRKRKRA